MKTVQPALGITPPASRLSWPAGPLFRRHDADPVPDVPPLRRVMFQLMRRRSDGLVYHEAVYRMPAVRAWLRAFNRTHAVHATLFELLSYFCAQVLFQRPELNRFVSGGRLYQRRGVQIAFVVKRTLSDTGVGTTVKVEAFPNEPLVAFVARMSRLIDEARGPERTIDRETRLLAMLPGPLLRLLVLAARGLDAWNLYPRFMTAEDPMYASLFLANLGSVGVSDVYHHLYEYGTVSLFGTLSAVRRTPWADGDAVEAVESISLRWTFDERVHDAFYAGRALALVRRLLEDPAAWLGAPEGDPVFRDALKGAAHRTEQ